MIKKFDVFIIICGWLAGCNLAGTVTVMCHALSGAHMVETPAVQLYPLLISDFPKKIIHW
jgi:hypothetical protein